MFAKPLRKLLIFTSVVPLLLYSLFVMYLYIAQEGLIFRGTKLPTEHQFEFDVPFRELSIPVEGAELNALWFRQANPRGLVFFLHGNGGNLESWTSNVAYYQRVNYDMFMFDYRGYGKSTGSMQNEAQLHADVRAAWEVVAPHYDNEPIVIYGRSLGAALAARLAKDVRPDLLIMVSPFKSMLAMVNRQYPLVPSWLLRYPLQNDVVIQEIESPLVLVHGDADEFIPMSDSIALERMAKSTTQLLIIEEANHYDIHNFRSYIDGLTAVLPD